jgi:hypothetical protein
MKKFTTKFTGILLLFTINTFNAKAQMSQLGTKIVGTGSTTGSSNGISAAMNYDGTTAITGASQDASSVGAAFVYTRNSNIWTQQGTKLVGTGAIGTAYQGKSVAISNDGNTILVGGDGDNSNMGATWVFTRTAGVWSQQAKLVGTGNISSSAQGSSVSLSEDGNTAAIGGYLDNSAIGAVWIFTRSGTTWTQQQKLVGSGNTGQSYQGTSVSLSSDGNTVAFGGTNDNSNIGAVWVFTRSGSVWSQQGSKIVPTDRAGTTQRIGSSVSLSGNGNVLVFGGENDNNKGAAWVYTRTAGVWTVDGSKITGTDVPNNSVFGRSVSMVKTGNKFIIGGWNGFNSTFTERGAAYVFSKTGSTWEQEGVRMVGTDNIGQSYQGYSVAISGNGREAISGGNGDNSNTGACWFYKIIQSPLRGNMATFDGLNDCIAIPHQAFLKPSTHITIEAWVRPNNISTNGYYEIARKEDGSGRFLLSFQDGGTILSFGLGVGGSYSELDVAITASNYINQWVHIAAVYDGTQKIIYRNGVIIGTQNITGAINTTGTAPMYIGSWDGLGEFFNGSIDEFRFWNTARTQNQIRENMHLTFTGEETGLVAYYQFNETTGNAKDVAQSNNGVMTNGATRTTSTLSVSGGISARLNVNATGIYNFTGTNCQLNFTGTVPNGEVIVSKLNGNMVGTLPTGNSYYDLSYWVVNNYGTNSGLTVTPQFTLGASFVSALDAITPQNLKLNKRTINNAGAFTQINGTAANQVTGVIDFSSISSFSEMGISTIGNSILPIQLLNFSATLQNKNGILNWTIAEAENSTKYELQRSTTAQNFSTINTQIGNALDKNFGYTDASLTFGNHYYRLKITDANGTIQYSNTLLLKVNDKATNISVYPNPTKGVINVQTNESLINTNLAVFDVMGKTVTQFKITYTNFNIDLSNYNSGVYFLKTANGQIEKIIKQ